MELQRSEATAVMYMVPLSELVAASYPSRPFSAPPRIRVDPVNFQGALGVFLLPREVSSKLHAGDFRVLVAKCLRGAVEYLEEVTDFRRAFYNES